MKRLSSSRSTNPLHSQSLPCCSRRPYATTLPPKPELKWKVDVGSYSSPSSSTSASSSSSPAPEPYYDEEVNVFWPVTPLHAPAAPLSFLNSSHPTPTATHLFTDHGLPFRDLSWDLPSQPLARSRGAKKRGVGPKQSPSGEREGLSSAERGRTEGSRTSSIERTPEEEEDVRWLSRQSRTRISFQDTSSSSSTPTSQSASEAVIAARRSASVSSSHDALPSSDASRSQSTSSSSPSESTASRTTKILRPTITPTPIYNPPVEHVRPDRTAASRTAPPHVASEPEPVALTSSLQSAEPTAATSTDASSSTATSTSPSSRGPSGLPRSASGTSNPFSSNPIPDVSASTMGSYLAPLANALGQKKVPVACEGKAKFLNGDMRSLSDGESVSAGQRTLNTLKRALQFLDPHNAMPSRSKQLRQASSKVWIAPKRLLKEEGALYFPNLAGHSLRADLSEPIIHTTDVLKGRISLVSCAGSILSTEQVSSFSSPVWAAFKHDADFSLVHLNIQSTALKSLLVPYFVENIRASVPKEQHSTYLICPSAVHDSPEGEALGMKHALAGYVYLVDENLKIRWAGSGTASEEERKSLLIATQVLLHRFKTNVENESFAQHRYPAHKLSGAIEQWLINKPKMFQPPSLEAPTLTSEGAVPRIA